jgi:hypothetical protein
MLGIRTLLGLEPKGDVLTSVKEPVLPQWMGTLTVDGIPGRWGRVKVIGKGDDKTMLNLRLRYEEILVAREELGAKDLAA